MDGVIIDQTERKIVLAQKRGWIINKEDTPSDIIINKIPPGVYAEIQRDLYSDILTMKDPPLMKGVVSLLQFFEKLRVPCILISMRRNPEVAIALLQRHNIVPRYFSHERIFFVRETAEKNKKARELGITHYIDDEIRVLSVLPDIACRILFDPLGVFSSANEYLRV